MELFTVKKIQQVGKSETKTTVIASGVTKTMVDMFVSKSPRTVADTVFSITKD